MPPAAKSEAEKLEARITEFLAKRVAQHLLDACGLVRTRRDRVLKGERVDRQSDGAVPFDVVVDTAECEADAGGVGLDLRLHRLRLRVE